MQKKVLQMHTLLLLFFSSDIRAFGNFICKPLVGLALLTAIHGQNTCPAGTYRAVNSTDCLQCPVGMSSPPLSFFPTDCFCNASETYGPLGGPCELCSTCSANQFEISPCVQNSTSDGVDRVCQDSVCGNYVQEPGEECDNGPFSGGGCSSSCTVEPGFLCVLEPFKESVCCAEHTNPFTNEKVCNCDNVTSEYHGMFVKSDCSLEDHDECAANNGGCALGALCINEEATPTSNVTHKCVCPPGMVGDGISRCDIYVYQVSMKFAVQGASVFDFDEDLIKQNFIDNGVFPASVTKEDLTLTLSPYSGEFSGVRRLLQEQSTEAEVIVETDSPEQNEAVSSSVNMEQALNSLDEGVDGDQTIEMTQPPTQVVLTVDQAFGAVTTVLFGFTVDSIRYDNVAWEWILRARYVENAPNVITSPYLSKAGQPPYNQDVTNTYFVSQHPCMLTASICCMVDYSKHYTIGKFGDNVSSTLTDGNGNCDLSVQSQNTLDLMHTDSNDWLVENLLSEYPNSYVHRISRNTFDVHIHIIDLRDHISMVKDITSGYEMDFFLGMSYFTLLPASSISTISSQVKVQATYTDTVTFAMTSEQEYTFLQYITLGIVDTKTIIDFVEYNPQYVKVGFLIPDNLKQNTRTGLVPLTSVRFAVSTSLPDPDDAQWMNPCLSSSRTGLWDPFYNNSVNSIYSLYNAARSQSCSMQDLMCLNVDHANVVDRLVDFSFPLGDNLITPEMLTSSEPYSLYVSFQISLVDSDGAYVQTRLFAQTAITPVSMTRVCRELEIANELKDVVDISMTVGVVGVEEEWATTIKEFDHMEDNQDALVELSVDGISPSIMNGLVTIVLQGTPAPFENPLASAYHLEIDDLFTMHFLHDTTYNNVISLLDAGSAFTIKKNEANKMLEVDLAPAILSECFSEVLPGDMTCMIRRDIAARVPTDAYAVHSLATGVNTNDIAQTSAWMQEHVLGYSEYADDLARNFTNLIRNKYDINDRYRKAYYLNPGYKWTMQAGAAPQSLLSLSDKMIMFAVMTLDDDTGFEKRRRMLLQVTTEGGVVTNTFQKIVENPIGGVFPSLDYQAVDQYKQIASVYGMTERYNVIGIKIKGGFNPELSKTGLRDRVQKALRASKGGFAPQADSLWVVHFKQTEVMPIGRRLLQVPGYLDFAADVEMLLNFSDFNVKLFKDELEKLEDTEDQLLQIEATFIGIKVQGASYVEELAAARVEEALKNDLSTDGGGKTSNQVDGTSSAPGTAAASLLFCVLFSVLGVFFVTV